MGDRVTVSGRTLKLSNKTPGTLTYTLTETDHPALKTEAQDNAVLINAIMLQCSCSGDYVTGTSTFVGSGTASITAGTPRVECEDMQIIKKGDSTTITCSGTITTTANGATACASP